MKKRQLTNEQPREKSGRYSFKVIVAGNCVLCGKRVDADNIFFCKDCQSKQNAESEGKKTKERTTHDKR